MRVAIGRYNMADKMLFKVLLYKGSTKDMGLVLKKETKWRDLKKKKKP